MRPTSKDGTVSWTVIVPVKRLTVAKSRLRGALADVDHAELVLAMALDTICAALASPVVGRMVVVTSDADATKAALDVGAEVVDDVPDAGLNPALAYAATQARSKAAAATLPAIAALAADLPCLRTEELTDALRSAPMAGRAYVTDAARTGTVLLTAAPGAQLEPCFGARSAAAHAASGAVELSGAWPTLRRDVDTAEDLVAAAALGLGPRTAATLGTRWPSALGSADATRR